jgi:hypothetical protein
LNAAERTAAIQQRRQSTGRTQRLWVRDGWREFPVYEVPVDALLLNVDNRRFAAERKLIEAEIDRTLDPENSPDDERAVMAILLDSGVRVIDGTVEGRPSKDYEALKTDWILRKQETPFWVRPDGTVRNGNRRLAMIKRLAQEMGDTAFQFVEAVLLDVADIDEQQLFDMEQREQLTENLKLRYTDINLLLTIKDAATARGIDWADPESVAQVAGQLQHLARGNQGYAEVLLRTIWFMDQFLIEEDAEGEYERVIGNVERFRDIGRNMDKLLPDFAEDAPDMLAVCFAAVRAGQSHLNIRALRRMYFDDRERFDALVAEVNGIETEWRTTGSSELGLPDLVEVDAAREAADELSDEVDDDDEPPGPVVPNYPRPEVESRFNNAIDGFGASQTMTVASQLETALDRLNSAAADGRLDAALAEEDDSRVRELLGALIAWTDSVRSTL